MTQREVHILSYFSLPTDLVGAMRDWREFKGGEGYAVDLESSEGEIVSVRRESGDDQYVSVVGTGSGHLFDRVLGRVVHALAADSDNLMIYRWDARISSQPAPE